jgi:hypothetical protein
MTQLIFAAAGFILAGMTMGLLVWRDSRPRRDDWHTIIRRVDQPPPREQHHTRGYCDRREHDDERLGSEE